MEKSIYNISNMAEKCSPFFNSIDLENIGNNIRILACFSEPFIFYIDKLQQFSKT